MWSAWVSLVSFHGNGSWVSLVSFHGNGSCGLHGSVLFPFMVMVCGLHGSVLFPFMWSAWVSLVSFHGYVVCMSHVVCMGQSCFLSW